MDKRIILQKPELISDGAGGYKPAGANKFVDAGTVWAEFKTPKFSTQEVAGAVASVGIREIKIWYRADVVKGWRVLYGSDKLSVNHVYHIGRNETFLVVKEMVK
nr:phage head closure protein [Sporomusa ovata]